MFDKTPKTIGIIDFDSLIHVCQISYNDALSNLQACNFAITSLCRKQSHTLGRSVSSEAYSPAWSRDF